MLGQLLAYHRLPQQRQMLFINYGGIIRNIECINLPDTTQTVIKQLAELNNLALRSRVAFIGKSRYYVINKSSYLLHSV